MKKIICILLAVFVCFMLTGCNGEARKELQALAGKEVNEKLYTPDSYAEYLAALEEAEKSAKNFFVRAVEIEQAKKNLQEKFEQLCLKPDKTALKIKAEEVSGMDRSLYLSASLALLEKASEEAKAVLTDENATEEEVKAAIEKIDHGIQGLQAKPDKTALLELIAKAELLPESKYTTASYESLKEALRTVKGVAANEEATKAQVEAAQTRLSEGISSLVTATKGVYKLYFDFSMLSNAHVGNEWSYWVNHNGKAITSGAQITAALGAPIKINATVEEDDSIPDVGTASLSVPADGSQVEANITVRENAGRYTGNVAVWKITAWAVLAERV